MAVGATRGAELSVAGNCGPGWGLFCATAWGGASRRLPCGYHYPKVTPEVGRAKRVGPGHPESHNWVACGTACICETPGRVRRASLARSDRRWWGGGLGGVEARCCSHEFVPGRCLAITTTRRVTPEAGRAKRVGPGHPESHKWVAFCTACICETPGRVRRASLDRSGRRWWAGGLGGVEDELIRATFTQ